MLKVNKLVDYALLVLRGLFECRGGLSRASELAERSGLPLPTVRKCLQVMLSHGLIASASGVKGGYRLVKPLDAISLADLLCAFDGPLTVVSCLQG